MRISIVLVVMACLYGCAGLPETKFRYKNYKGERTEAQREQDWQFCRELFPPGANFQDCIARKGYYLESYLE